MSHKTQADLEVREVILGVLQSFGFSEDAEKKRAAAEMEIELTRDVRKLRELCARQGELTLVHSEAA